MVTSARKCCSIHMTISTRQVVRISRKHMACSGHGQWAWLRWLAKDTICNACGPCRTIQSISKPVFVSFDLLIVLTSWSDADNRQQTKLIALPLAHAHRVMTSLHALVSLAKLTLSPLGEGGCENLAWSARLSLPLFVPLSICVSVCCEECFEGPMYTIAPI